MLLNPSGKYVWVGILGCGYWGSKHAHVMSSTPGVSEICLIDSNPAVRVRLQATFGNARSFDSPHQALPHVDALVIATPPTTHAELRDDLNAAWSDAVDTRGFMGDPAVDRFEASRAGYCQTNHRVGLSSGTATLRLALTALGIGAGDEALVPANTLIARATAVAATGVQPVFVEVAPKTLFVTSETLRPGRSHDIMIPLRTPKAVQLARNAS